MQVDDDDNENEEEQKKEMYVSYLTHILYTRSTLWQ